MDKEIPKASIVGKNSTKNKLIRKVCRTNDVEILAGHVGMNHIHLSVPVPLHILASKLVQYMKGNTSRKLLKEFKKIE